MGNKVGGLILFWIGSALMIILGWAYSWWMVPKIIEVGQQSASSLFVGILWGMALPLGGVLAALGAAVYTRENRARVLSLIIGGFVLIFLLSLLPALKSVPSALFGIGGGLIVLAYMGIIWNWIRTRSKLSKVERLGADLKITGYLFILITAWFLCGLLGAPTLLLRPELSEQYGTIGSAVNMAAYNVFIPLVIGWILVSVGHIISGKALRAK